VQIIQGGVATFELKVDGMTKPEFIASLKLKDFETFLCANMEVSFVYKETSQSEKAFECTLLLQDFSEMTLYHSFREP
jgi:hypothetical protein